MPAHPPQSIKRFQELHKVGVDVADRLYKVSQWVFGPLVIPNSCPSILSVYFTKLLTVFILAASPIGYCQSSSNILPLNLHFGQSIKSIHNLKEIDDNINVATFRYHLAANLFDGIETWKYLPNEYRAYCLGFVNGKLSRVVVHYVTTGDFDRSVNLLRNKISMIKLIDLNLGKETMVQYGSVGSDYAMFTYRSVLVMGSSTSLKLSIIYTQINDGLGQTILNSIKKHQKSTQSAHERDRTTRDY